MTKLLLPTLFLISIQYGYSQEERFQFFDGADTTHNSIIFNIDTSYNENIWQIGEPEKVLFDTASSSPNVIVTDTNSNYPINNSSSFTFTLTNLDDFYSGILAIQWMQKLDLEDNQDYGIIEYSVNGGEDWTNPLFDDPYVYNFYGFNGENATYTVDGQPAFTGVDTNWRDIWLCMDISWLALYDSIIFKYRILSDETDSGQEGWMMDNFYVHPTWFHTINENPESEYLKVYPNPTNKGIINIQAIKNDDYHLIEKMELRNMNGQLIRSYGQAPTKFWIDISDIQAGNYLLTIQTNLKTETFKIIHHGE